VDVAKAIVEPPAVRKSGEAAEVPRSIPMVVVNQEDPESADGHGESEFVSETVASVPRSTVTKQRGADEESTNQPGPRVESKTVDAEQPPVVTQSRVEPDPANSSRPIRQTAVPLFGGLQAKDQEQAELFHNRISKRAKHLRRWPTKRGITCFRLYERDIPEIPLVVDRFEDYLHITEYERPHERDLARHAAWLELMKKTAASTLELPISHVFLKRRRKDNDTRQYEKINSLGKLIPVHEGGLTFMVNLSDYVDTGLFLDHRLTRQMVRDEAQGKDFLNLFAYTGSFSVYAASGGATSTTTVDLSRNYLDWAQENFRASCLSGPAHRMVAGDSIEFLESASRDPRQRFDLAVVDPPTFSNSKRTELDWDVQTRHVELLTRVREVMRPGGTVYFSTNFRRFKFREDELSGFECREISKQTVPEDFRNRRIHRCWRLACTPF
jgi:23S rRNA (guanine2445-N2)-methyltransferase / 23S rRNA (guanine2069-N7)-methyltransferase